MRLMLAWMCLVIPCLAAAVPYAGAPSGAGLVYRAGVEYQEINVPIRTENADKIEVREFFFYGCPHCFKLEPAIEAFKQNAPDDVAVIRTPGVLNPSWQPLGRAYFVAETLGVTEKIHRPLFNAIHLNHEKIYDEAAIRAFFVKMGVKGEEFDKLFNSFGVTARIKQADALARQARITGVPAFVVNGKYLTSVSMTGSEEKLFDVINYLVEKERTQ